ncbi:molybdate ABC transporter ATP-binding protein ModF [Aliagarivorans marinus]|uniref:molybdate ABC transporter ATP-binding protein ModF n=1 Tax=Aliagarivorans marinus TaxID=561965 RepID=UPI0003FA923D|nr:molybdate ABC transporter ATP-binding protein ModF [Aliagarivorans marinus]
MRICQLALAGSQHKLAIKDWDLANQHWALFGSSGSGKSLLGEWLAGLYTAEQGRVENLPEPVGLVSLAEQQRLLELELEQDDSDFSQVQEFGHSVAELLHSQSDDPSLIATVVGQCDLSPLLTRGFRQLSTGESRRLMLALALLRSPRLLLLDEPFAGLDVEHQQQLMTLLQEVAKGCQLLLITSRDEELPECISHVALLDEQGLSRTFSRQQWLNNPEREQLTRLAQKQAKQLTEQLRSDAPEQAEQPLFSIRNGRVSYGGEELFSGLDWQINPGEHWQVSGPNGCGKSTLLSLISGDHPQCYSNDIEVLGYRRGSGESIWQIKQQLGIVSSALHLQYRVSCKAIEVVLSGLFDSIGLYQAASLPQQRLAMDWLALLGMDELALLPFKELSYGQQRLLLIARALIKQPRLLLLDEPCQGLDFLHRQVVLSALERIAEQQLCQLVYVTHHQEDRLPSVTHRLSFSEHGFELV